MRFYVRILATEGQKEKWTNRWTAANALSRLRYRERQL